VPAPSGSPGTSFFVRIARCRSAGETRVRDFPIQWFFPHVQALGVLALDGGGRLMWNDRYADDAHKTNEPPGEDGASIPAAKLAAVWREGRKQRRPSAPMLATTGQ
jgi:hypothetical protein